jgi:TolB protein
MKKAWIAVLLFAGFGALAVTQELPEEPHEGMLPPDPGEVHLSISQGAGTVTVAVPPFLPMDMPPSMREAAVEIRQALLDDMSLAWSMATLSGSLYQYVEKYGLQDLKLQEWRALGADAVFYVTLGMEGESLKAEGRLFDVRTGDLIFGKRLVGEKGLQRKMAHTYADEMTYHYTGRKGPFGTPIVFCSTKGEKRYNKGIWSMDYDGYGLRPVVSNGFLNILPQWTRDSKKILYTSYASGAPNLFFVDRYALRPPEQLTRMDMAAMGKVSPDGERVVFSASDGYGNIDVYTIRRDGSGIQRLSTHSAIDTAPCWSSTGREIAFTSDRSSSPQIYVMDAEGTNPRRVSWASNYCDAPVWSPDGSRLLYVTRMQGRFHLTVLDLTTGEEIRVTRDPARHEGPTWSPDGSMIAYSSTASGSAQIYVMRSDGTRARQITFEGENTQPSWAPLP